MKKPRIRYQFHIAYNGQVFKEIVSAVSYDKAKAQALSDFKTLSSVEGKPYRIVKAIEFDPTFCNGKIGVVIQDKYL